MITWILRIKKVNLRILDQHEGLAILGKHRLPRTLKGRHRKVETIYLVLLNQRSQQGTIGSVEEAQIRIWDLLISVLINSRPINNLNTILNGKRIQLT